MRTLRLVPLQLLVFALPAFAQTFDHHGTAYGTGSVVFVQSPNGNEYWNLYHGIERSLR